jgi:hypothetical protein
MAWSGSKTTSFTGVVRADREMVASTGSGGIKERRWIDDDN